MRVEAAAEFGVDFTELRVPEPDEPKTPPAWLPEVGGDDRSASAPATR